MKFIKSNLYDILFIYFGIFLCLFCFGNSFTLCGLDRFILLLFIFPMIVIKIVETDKQKWLISLLIIITLFMLVNFSTIVNGVTHIIHLVNSQSTNYNSYYVTQPAFITMLFIYMILTITITFCVLRKRGLIFVILISGCLFIPTTYSETINWYIVVLMLSYWSLLFFTCNKRARMFTQTRSYKIVIIITVLAFSLNLIIPKDFDNQTPSLIDIFKNTQKVFNSQNSPTDVLNLEHQGNRIYHNIMTVTIEADIPQDSYLKFFSAGIYQDNHWMNISEEEYEASTINWINVASIKTMNEVNNFNIQALRQAEYKLIPYGYANTTELEIMNDSFILADSSKYNVALLYPDYVVNHSTVYKEFVEEHYTVIPTELEDVFNKMDMYNEVNGGFDYDTMELIANYLADNCTYTLEPGFLPAGKDFVAYFLQESKEGYCVHFATAATMIARYMGIPARYVEGYHVENNDFDHNNSASLYDYNQHAWVEIYDEYQGWIPFEVTPSSNYIDTNENQTNNTEEDIPEVDDLENNEDNQQNQTNIPKNNENGFKIMMNIDPSIVLLMMIGLLAILLLIGFPKYVKKQIQVKVSNPNRKLAVLYCKKYLSICSLVELVHKDIFDKAAYSQYEISEDEYQIIMQYFINVMQKEYQSITFINKFHYIYKLVVITFMKSKR